MSRPLAFLASLFALLAFPALARAGRLVDLAVVDRDSGTVLPPYESDGRRYVAGTPGHRYAVRLTNRTGGRVLVVLSVDGVNAVSGETASPDQAGYVLDPHATTEIAGWRKSLDEIARFHFTALSASYAARTGRPGDVGVIGAAVFAERAAAVVPRAKIAGRAADAAPAPASAAPSSRAESLARAPQTAGEPLGTGHGAREIARVEATPFDRATAQPAETVAIWYDSYANLAARGIVPRSYVRRDPPQPFPGGFVPDPGR